MDPLETLISRGQQKFEIYNQQNRVQLIINDDRF